jgi:hypothetical protein
VCVFFSLLAHTSVKWRARARACASLVAHAHATRSTQTPVHTHLVGFVFQQPSLQQARRNVVLAVAHHAHVGDRRALTRAGCVRSCQHNNAGTRRRCNCEPRPCKNLVHHCDRCVCEHKNVCVVSVIFSFVFFDCKAVARRAHTHAQADDGHDMNKGVWQLKKLVVAYCPHGGSSRGARFVCFFFAFFLFRRHRRHLLARARSITLAHACTQYLLTQYVLRMLNINTHTCTRARRAFVESRLPNFVADNPQVEVEVVKRGAKHPFVRGHYGQCRARTRFSLPCDFFCFNLCASIAQRAAPSSRCA